MAKYLTDKQHSFLEEFSDSANEKAALEAAGWKKSQLRKALMDTTGEFYKQFSALIVSMESDTAYGKWQNLEYLVAMRDDAMANGDKKMALELIREINKMSGNLAPMRQEVNNTTLNITAKVENGKLDMTKGSKKIGETGYDE